MFSSTVLKNCKFEAQTHSNRSDKSEMLMKRIVNKVLRSMKMSVGISSVVLAASFVIGSSSAFAAGNVANGEKISAVCSACHGSDGNSSVPSFPKIAGLGESYLLKQLKDVKSGARSIPEMTGLLDNNSDQDLQDLAAFYNSKALVLSGSKEMKVRINSGAEVDALKLGTQVYRAGNLETHVPACSGCHSPTGMGNGPAGFPRLSGQYAEYIEKQLKAFRAGERTNDGDSMVMRSIAKHMSDAEIIAVANFIAGLN